MLTIVIYVLVLCSCADSKRARVGVIIRINTIILVLHLDSHQRAGVRTVVGTRHSVDSTEIVAVELRGTQLCERKRREKRMNGGRRLEKMEKQEEVKLRLI